MVSGSFPRHKVIGMEGEKGVGLPIEVVSRIGDVTI